MGPLERSWRAGDCHSCRRELALVLMLLNSMRCAVATEVVVGRPAAAEPKLDGVLVFLLTATALLAGVCWWFGFAVRSMCCRRADESPTVKDVGVQTEPVMVDTITQTDEPPRECAAVASVNCGLVADTAASATASLGLNAAPPQPPQPMSALITEEAVRAEVNRVVNYVPVSSFTDTELNAVLAACARLEVSCCGGLPTDHSGTNQYYLRLKCRACGRLALRYKRKR